MTRRWGKGACLALAFLAFASARAAAQSSDTESQFWPGLALRYQWPSALSAQLYSQIKDAEDFPYQQLGVGTRLGYQRKALTRPHLVNTNPEKEHQLFLGVGYEYLATLQSGTSSTEDRLSAEITGRHRPWARVLLTDRNQFEFRWVNDVYSTRYRNKLGLEYDVMVDRFRFTPYVSAEVFYDWAKSSWNEQQYALGVEWPYRQRFTLTTYYLRQNCTTCNPAHVDAAGLSLGFFFGAVR